MEEELGEEKKAELRRIADITWEAILAAHEKASKLSAKTTTQASD